MHQNAWRDVCNLILAQYKLCIIDCTIICINSRKHIKNFPFFLNRLHLTEQNTSTNEIHNTIVVSAFHV